MIALKNQFPSARLLNECLSKLAAILESPYDPAPHDPSEELFNAAISVTFFCECLLSEIMSLRKYDLRGTGALRLAIALGNNSSTKTLLLEELADIAAEDHEYRRSFFKEIEGIFNDKRFGEDWMKLIQEKL